MSTAVRLVAFNLPQIKAITDHDDMDLYTLGEKKFGVSLDYIIMGRQSQSDLKQQLCALIKSLSALAEKL